MRYVSAPSRHDSGVCTCLGESGFCLSILVYLLGLIFVFSSSLVSFFYFSMLLLLFFRSLVRLASLSSLFSNRARRHGMSCVTPRWSCGALPGLAALGLVARRSSASPGSAPMRVCFKLFQGRSCTPLTHGHLLCTVEEYRPLQCSRSLALLLVGRTGWWHL